jgi:hypothetical protein
MFFKMCFNEIFNAFYKKMKNRTIFNQYSCLNI